MDVKYNILCCSQKVPMTTLTEAERVALACLPRLRWKEVGVTL